jgi:RHS repeat-associated protein
MFVSLTHSSAMAALLWLLLLVISASAQTTTTSATDKMTPSGLAPGSPAGSYALSGFDNINLFNGNLNFRLPLLTMGGRGEASFTMMLAINDKQWRVKRQQTHTNEPVTTFIPIPNPWNGLEVGYGPGVLQGRQSGVGEQYCVPAGHNIGDATVVTFRYSVTTLTFKTPDGTEYELVDQPTLGKPLFVTTPVCSATNTTQGEPRGNVFVTRDGTSATFVSDAPIYDKVMPPRLGDGLMLISPSGILTLHNGVRYRIDHGIVSWIRDRNGNFISFGTDGVFATDSLKRQVKLSYDASDPTCGACDKITFKGFGGAERAILIQKKHLSDPGVLHTGYTIHTYYELFQLNGASTVNNYDPLVVSAVILPNGQSYQFKYNSYGELAWVTLPTGGAIEYVMAYGSGVLSGGSFGEEYQIYRRVAERRTYEDGMTMTSRTTYTLSGTAVIEEQLTPPPTGTVLARTKHYFIGEAAESLFDKEQGDIFTAWNEGKEAATEAIDPATGAVLRRVSNTWEQRASISWWSWWQSQYGQAIGEPANDPRLTQTVSTLFDTNQVSQQTFSYDQFNNRTDVYEYDYGAGVAGALMRHTHTDYLTINPINNADYTGTGIHLRGLPVQQSVYDAGGVERARVTYEYDNYGADSNHAALVPRYGISGLDAAYTSSYETRGNVTRTSSWLLPSNQAINSYAQYDVAGNAIKTIDPRGSATTINYADCYGAPDGEARANYGAVELNGYLTYALPTSATNALGHSVYAQYDYYLGRVVDGEDANGVTSSAFYNDVLDRPTQVVRAVNTAVKSQTTFSYNDTQRVMTTTSDQNFYGDNLLRSEAEFDGLGRSFESRQYEAANSYIATRQSYDAMGRVSQTSNPYRAGDALLWTTTQYDALSRPTFVTTPDNAVVSTSYSGSTVTVIDQAGKDRQSRTDALGRLTQVIEDPGAGGLNYQTAYGYDVLDDLITVTQGIQSRSFVYDSLKRLTSATNPESGTLSYQYDAAGNLTQKIDARGVVISYGYDSLNRATSRSYNDGTPSVTYTYDSPGIAYAKGRLTSLSSSVSATNYTAFDALGHATSSQQITDAQTYTLGYTYNLAGALISEVYPSGRTISTAYDTAGRITSVAGQKSGEPAKTYASALSYTAHGAVRQIQLGNGLWEHTLFNSRLQPTEIGLGTSSTDSSKLQLSYTYGTTTNNGNVQMQTISMPGLQLTQSYIYDSLNRLQSAQENNGASWRQTFLYDRYGNRNFDVANTTQAMVGLNLAIDQSTNRYSSGQGSILYDAAGNLTRDFQGHTFSFDAENHQSSYDNGAATYAYDPDGRRVKKLTGTIAAIYIYDIKGQLVAEYTPSYGSSSQGNSSQLSYLTPDSLGTPRVITDSTGTVKSRHDDLPFGEEITASVGGRTASQGYVADELRQKFTGKERDNETGLDFFGARYYANTQGRFTSADQLLSSGTVYDPQSWNRYSYTINNPLKYTDPFGLYVYDSSVTNDQRKKFEAGLKKAQEALKKLSPKSTEYQKLDRAIKAFGAVGVDNGVTIKFGATTDGSPAATGFGIRDKNQDGIKDVTADNPTGQDTVVTVDPTQHGNSVDYAIDIAHEGSHVADGADLVGALPSNLTNPATAAVLAGPLNLTKYETETRAYGVSAALAQGLGYDSLKIGAQGGNQYEIWSSGWSQADRAAKRTAGINKALAEPKSNKGLYGVTPTNQGDRLIP